MQNVRLGKIEPTAKVARRLGEFYSWIEDGEFAEAELIIKQLIRKHSHVPAVAEAEVYLYQALNDQGKLCIAAKRLLKATPRDPDAVMMYAQSSAFCGRACIAVIYYRKFLERWPDHENAFKAKEFIKICEPEAESRLKTARDSGFTSLALDNGGLELYAKHEECIEQLQTGNFKPAIEMCEEVLQLEPRFLSARNNLASCRFQMGELEKAIATARETCRLAPENRYAQANLAKLEFLTGNPDRANSIADDIMSSPPAKQDPLVAAIETMSYLGRDKDVLALCDSLDEISKIDDDILAIGLHHQAVATFRLGDKADTRRLWNRCLKLMPSHPDARENLADLNSNTGHAAWADSIGKWIPQPVVKRFVEWSAAKRSNPNADCPEFKLIQSLVPAMLDRGDPTARGLAFLLAKNNSPEPMFDVLQEFAFAERGPDAMRHEAMMFLLENNIIDEGPHRFFSRGAWTEVTLFAPEIVYEPLGNAEPWEKKLQEEGYYAQQDGEYEKAEEIWLRILERNPESISASFNLATIWLNHGGMSGFRKAKAKLEELHAREPDYTFAALALASIAAKDGDFDHARELLGIVTRKKRLHITEMSSLTATQAQIALMQDNVEAAEIAYRMLVDTVGEDDPTTMRIRRMIDSHGKPRIAGRIQQLLSKPW